MSRFACLLVRFAVAMSCLCAATTLAQAQHYPDRPIRLLVAFPPGGAADFVARLVGQLLSVRLGQPVVVENRPGSNGNIAGDLLAHAVPDGYTLFLGPSSLFSVNTHLYDKMTFDPWKQIVPVASVVEDELLLTENVNLPPRTFKAFIDYARQANPPLLYGSIGNGSEHHLAMELLKETAGIHMTHVPYRGGGPAALGVMGGEVAAMFGGGSVTPLVQAGKLRALAISGRKRSALFPDLPSISEIYPDYNVTIWQAILAPAGMPREIEARVRAETNAVIALPEYAKRLKTAGAGEPYITTPEELLARLHADDTRYAAVLKHLALRVN